MLDINTLKVGDTVDITRDGSTNRVTVQSDPERFGSHDERTVKIGYGPGRWNTAVSNAGQRRGFYALAVVETA